MIRDEVRAILQDELSAILDVDDLRLADETKAADVAGWDSLAHLKLLVALEPALGVKFQLSELNGSSNVGDLIDMILAKRAAKA